jgi:FkbM family methyltransferase
MNKDFNQSFKLQKSFSPDSRLYVFESLSPLCSFLNFHPQFIVQVGAANEGRHENHDIFMAASKVLLFEPNPKFYQELLKNYGQYPQITIYNIGIYKEPGKFKFFDVWACTYLAELEKPAVKEINNYKEKEEDAFYANCALFNGFDNGKIEMLLLDCEGCEWFILEDLKSRPVIISVETHCTHNNYKHPDSDKIFAWMTINNYVLLAHNESDSVFINRNNIQKVS